jgi:hypothetical protein
VTGSERLEYEKRVNRVIDHIHHHLGEELSLPELARIAELYRGNPMVDAKAGVFRCDLCVPVRPV